MFGSIKSNHITVTRQTARAASATKCSNSIVNGHIAPDRVNPTGSLGIIGQTIVAESLHILDRYVSE